MSILPLLPDIPELKVEQKEEEQKGEEKKESKSAPFPQDLYEPYTEEKGLLFSTRTTDWGEICGKEVAEFKVGDPGNYECKGKTKKTLEKRKPTLEKGDLFAFSVYVDKEFPYYIGRVELIR